MPICVWKTQGMVTCEGSRKNKRMCARKTQGMEACAGSRWDSSVTGRKGKFETQNPVVRFIMDKLATATSWLNKGSRQEIKPTKSPVHPDINTGDSWIVSPRREAHESLLTHPIINNSGILSEYSYHLIQIVERKRYRFWIQKASYQENVWNVERKWHRRQNES